MCGIGGVLKVYTPDDLAALGGTAPPHDESIPDAWLDTLDDSIKHRGPDGAGRFRDRARRPDGSIVDVALVHRRLSIIDHAGGAQPMVHVRGPRQHRATTTISDHIAGRSPGITLINAHEDFDDPDRATDLIAVAFNGCIYNHRALRAELQASGHTFQTDHCDTEVLIHGWREWGMDMQDKLDGMYAALVWHRRDAQIACLGDLCGEKKIYSHSWPRKDSAFSSSHAGLLRLRARLDRPESEWGHGAAAWMQFGSSAQPPEGSAAPNPGYWCLYNPSPTAFDEDPSPYPAGTPEMLLWSAPKKPERVSRPLDTPHDRTPTDSLRHAVTSRLEADVPLGLFLSGGLDSALIAAIAHKHKPDLAAYTVRMPEPSTSSGGPGYDESRDASATAAAIGIKHHILDCPGVGSGSPGDQPARDLIMLIEQVGVPFGDSSLLPTYWVCKAAREHVKVALSGDGGDELFGGYRRHTISPHLGRWRHFLRLIPTRVLDQRSPGSRSTYLARLAIAARHGGYDELRSIFPTPDLRRLLAIEEQRVGGGAKFEHVEDPLRHDFDHYLPDDLLRKTDTASMAVALEVRAPFLARELVRDALSCPLEHLMPRGERKGLLKQIARQYLPDHVIDRPKRGFAIPTGHWFRTDFGGLRTLLHDHLHSADPFPGLDAAGVRIKMDTVRRLLKEHDHAGERSPFPWHGRDHSQRLYMLLVLSIWATWLNRIRKGTRQTVAVAS